MMDFLGKSMPKDLEGVLCKLQAATLASARPLISAWQNLLGEGVQEEPDMVVPATEVLAMVQRTLCLIGSPSGQISRVRRAKILEAIDPTWKKFSDDPFPSAKGTLFGEEFQSSLKDTAISKAVTISKRSRKDAIPATSSRREGANLTGFFEGALLEGTEPGRAEASSRTAHLFKENIRPAQATKDSSPQHKDSAGNPFTTSRDFPRTATILNINPYRGATLPRSRLKSLGIVMDMSIPRREAHRPVGGGIALFVDNWHRISQDPWIRETVTAHKLDLASSPFQHRVPREVNMEPEKV
jgi:hypothetical protein